MTSAVPGTKKTALCRYFINTGSCIYGDECQFLHQNPGPGCLDIPQKHFPNGSVSSHDNQGLHFCEQNCCNLIFLLITSAIYLYSHPCGLIQS